MVVFLVQVGRQRFELYSETPDEPVVEPGRHEPFYTRWLHAMQVQWHALVDAARRGTGRGRFRRWCDAAVCHLAESIAEQRTLWTLRHHRSATTRYPATVDDARALAILRGVLGHARHHHLMWFLVDLALFVATAIIAIVPGPNVLAYYMLFRVIGHLQSWRGARHAMDTVTWTMVEDKGLAELAALVDVPRDARASRVAAIADRLNLPRLSAFFDRVAVPSA